MFDRPLLLAAIAVFGLLAWGVVTFVAVRRRHDQRITGDPAIKRAREAAV